MQGETGTSGWSDTASSGPYVLDWDEDRRLLRATFRDDRGVSGDDADVLVPRVRAWVGEPDTAPYGWLVDASHLAGTDVASRSLFTRLLEDHRDAAHVAWFAVDATTALVLDLLRRASPELSVTIAADEAAAMAWLADRVPTL